MIVVYQVGAHYLTPQADENIIQDMQCYEVCPPCMQRQCLKNMNGRSKTSGAPAAKKPHRSEVFSANVGLSLS